MLSYVMAQGYQQSGLGDADAAAAAAAAAGSAGVA
jgi:hypothetical protein